MAIEIIWTNTFKRRYKKWQKKYPEFQKSFEKNLKIFTITPYAPELKTHKLSGILKDFWAFSINYDQRFVFEFTEKELITAINIGPHNQVY